MAVASVAFVVGGVDFGGFQMAQQLHSDTPEKLDEHGRTSIDVNFIYIAGFVLIDDGLKRLKMYC